MLTLTKGGKVNLTKEGITTFRMGLAWDANAGTGAAFDLDAAAIPLKEDGKDEDGNTIFKAVADDALCFYGQLNWKDAIKHSGDERTGAAEGDDETITINTDKLPAEVAKVVVLVNIHDAKTRQQNFGMVKNSKVTLYKGESGVAESDILAKYDLEEDASMSRCLIFCEIYKKDGEWRFKAVNESKGSFNDTTYHQVLSSYGIASEPSDL